MMTDGSNIRPHDQLPNGSHNNAQMAHPSVPQLNTIAIPNALASPGAGGMGSPTSAGGSIRRAAPEPNKRTLYVGGLDPQVTEEVVRQIFETTGTVKGVKIIPDKNHQSKGLNYGFIEYEDLASAERAMQTLNGRHVFNNEIRVNWAYQSTASAKEDTSNHCHIFVGDLSNEVNDEILLQAFSAFGSVSEARVMWDMKTGRSRGYGFVAFRDRNEAEHAIAAMNGEWLGSRAIRCNWANQKGQPSMAQSEAMMQVGMNQQPTFAQQHPAYNNQPVPSYEAVVSQSSSQQTTCYVGNLTPYTTQNDLVPLFSQFGYVVETRFQSDRGFAFVKMDSHENAALAICQLSGYSVNGRPLKCSWGKDRSTGQFEGFSPQSSSQTPTFPPTPTNYFPQYGGPSGPMSPQAHNNPHSYAQPPNGAYGGGGYQQQGYGRGGQHAGAHYGNNGGQYAYNGGNQYGGYQT